MLLNILNIVAPVFLVIGAGYLYLRSGWFADSLVDGLMKYAIQLAVPCLLFRATSTLDLASAFNWQIISSFYLAASLSFFAACLVVWKWFRRNPEESVAIGFAALFSNSVLLGLPISERAWGVDNLSEVYAIISLHAPFCYLLGITLMEIIRSDGRRWPETARIVVAAMFSNSLMIGIGLGFAVNLSGFAVPQIVTSAVDIISASALPVALFGLGGVLARYHFASELKLVAMVSLFSLVVHPALALLFCHLLQADLTHARTAVLLAAMAPGINSYLFASMYRQGQGIAASTVLLGTGVSVLSVSVWLWLLSGS